MINYNEPIYDPFGERGETHYHPANAAAEKYSTIQLIYRDIRNLLRLCDAQKDLYLKRLIAKYVVIEFFSLDPYVTDLSNMVIQNKKGYKATQAQVDVVKQYYSIYKKGRKRWLSDLKVVRNKIAAHREWMALTQMARNWDKLDLTTVKDISKLIEPFLNILQELNIYFWTKTGIDAEGREVVAIISPIDESDFRKLKDR